MGGAGDGPQPQRTVRRAGNSRLALHRLPIDFKPLELEGGSALKLRAHLLLKVCFAAMWLLVLLCRLFHDEQFNRARGWFQLQPELFVDCLNKDLGLRVLVACVRPFQLKIVMIG